MVAVVVQRIKLLPVELMSHVCTDLNPDCFTVIQRPATVPWKTTDDSNSWAPAKHVSNPEGASGSCFDLA